MTRQTAAPFDRVNLSPTYREARGLVTQIERGELILDTPYQRGDVWTDDQRIALIQSWLRGIPSGVIILSDRGAGQWTGADPYETGQGMWACVDGKQRLTTAMMWMHSELAVPASWIHSDLIETVEDTEDGPYVRRSGLTKKVALVIERNLLVQVAEAKHCATEAEEAALYLLVNGGGTQQTEADMANAARVAGA